VLEITDDRAGTIAKLKPDWQPDSDTWIESPFLLVGSVDSIADDLRGYRESLGFTYFVLRGAMAAVFAPVIAKLKGE
jgi:hypothetical protein